MAAPRIALPGLCLRPVEPREADAVARAAQESMASVGRWMPWCHARYGREDALAWIALAAQAIAAGSAFELGVFADDGEFAGSVGLNQFNTLHNFCNLGYWVRESRQGAGIATRAARAMAAFGFGELALTRIEIVVAEGNAASAAVARKLGGRHECVARNRLMFPGGPVAAAVYALVPADLA